MAETTSEPGQDQPGGGGSSPMPLEPIPFMQRLLDNPFVLLFLGVVIPTVFYLIWGILEVAQIPIAK